MFCEAVDELNLVIPGAGQEVYNHLAMVITMAMDSKELQLYAPRITGMQWFMADYVASSRTWRCWPSRRQRGQAGDLR